MSTPEAAFKATDDILAAVPERCKQCIRPRRDARDLGLEVAEGAISLEDARQGVAKGLEENCYLGMSFVGGCVGSTAVCGYRRTELTNTEIMNAAFRLGVDPASANSLELLVNAVEYAGSLDKRVTKAT